MNFGQRAFSYTPPTGFKAILIQHNLPDPTILHYLINSLKLALWDTGNGGHSDRDITGFRVSVLIGFGSNVEEMLSYSNNLLT